LGIGDGYFLKGNPPTAFQTQIAGFSVLLRRIGNTAS